MVGLRRPPTSLTRREERSRTHADHARVIEGACMNLVSSMTIDLTRIIPHGSWRIGSCRATTANSEAHVTSTSGG
ncbi:hypothetical protein COMA2_20319 [Candidatus Nitrospira nitrificans]|uniref:Uncharacterized protein n=1 Tax=Candidatus Nitrospira nitrificans TaxID=1742973 RepID=A0A0S4LG45_9BACT|nr:hypothetical protein COMA2_20319 [Candidatus Nitrospira nitrificans]